MLSKVQVTPLAGRAQVGIYTAAQPEKGDFCKRRKCLVVDAEEGSNRAGLRCEEYAVSPCMRVEVRKFKDANVCSPICNMQVAVSGRS